MSGPHPFIRLWDRIATLDVHPHAKSVLWSLVRHGDWGDGSKCRPAVARLAAETGLSRRQVQYVLRWLTCTLADAAEGRCQLAGCHHYGLLTLVSAEQGAPRVYAIDLTEKAGQPLLPEAWPLREQEREVEVDVYRRVVRRSWP